ncbi:hypothetical protein G9F72_024090 [Clostridium estertheticum]|uniref:hypothetical protein n=1 Tax=Clostridium estertheticum TaxID=238834 RepID=UPI0013E9195A|nr:hypothetical protein [Clostridium estertheticum]MBZ9689382.1 hypothetical protein [Clostridium estertheticum]
MKEFEEEIFEEEYIDKDRIATDIVFAIIKERIRIGLELISTGFFNEWQISEITGLTVKDIMAMK